MADEAMALACGGGTNDAGVIGKSVCSFFTACYLAVDFERVDCGAPPFASGASSVGPPVLRRSSAATATACRGPCFATWAVGARPKKSSPGPSPISKRSCRGPPGTHRSPWPSFESCRAGWPRRRRCCWVATTTCRRYCRQLASTWPGATLTWPGPPLAGGCASSAATGFGPRPCSACWSRPSSDEATWIRRPRRQSSWTPVPAAWGSPLDAEAARQRARVSAARGDTATAVTALEDALDGLAAADLPLLKASMHLQLAHLREAAGDRAEALVDRRAAAALLGRLDVVVAAEDAALLGRLGIEGARRPVGMGCRVATLERDGEWWTAGCGDTRVRLRDSKGLRYLADLISHAGTERHALDLVDVVEGVATADLRIDRRRLGTRASSSARTAVLRTACGWSSSATRWRTPWP